jgi:hypothetical protein
MRIEHHHSHLT